jgi:N-acetylglucosaminyl-diphospho-decaprenol L-rhamnosyltransferase
VSDTSWIDDLSAVVVSYGCRRETLALVSRLGPHMSVRVCDNDGDFPPVPGVHVLLPGTNIGFAAGVNLAARDVDTGFLLIANADTNLDTQDAAQLLAAIRSAPGTAALGPRLVYPDGRPQINGGRFSGLGIELARTAGVGPRVRDLRGRLRAEARGSLQPRVVVRDWISGAAMVLRVNAFREVGGFDERFEMYFEDEDLCRRLRRHGYACGVHTAVTVTHRVGGSAARGADPYRTAAYERSRLRYHAKHSSRLTATLSAWSARARHPVADR